MGALNFGVIISGANEEYQGTILSGIHQYAQENDINIAHFIAFGGVLDGNRNDIGEFNIFNLINYDMLDGVILLTNTISSPEIADRIINTLKEMYIPVSSIDRDIEEFHHVGIDNYKAMREVIEHIVIHHKITDINFISGTKTNPENILRFKAYKDVLAEHNIPYDESKVYYGLFRERDGNEGVEEFIRTGKVGKAIVCANDATAIGAVSTLEENGYRIPDDVIVTGFDNVFNAKNYNPPITSVSRPLKKSGYIACQQVHNCILEKEQERSVILNTELATTASCGCCNGACDEISLFKKETYQMMEMYHHDVPLVNTMACNLAECNSIDLLKEKIKRYIEQIKCEKFFLCLCDDWTGEKSDDTPIDEYLREGYTEMVTVPLVYCENKFGAIEAFRSEIMLQDLYVNTSCSKRYYFSPLHFNDRCLGYAIICNSDFPLKSPLYHNWIINVSNAIENVRKNSYIERTLRKLENLYTKDPLSQIFNRNGFQENTEEIYLRCVNEHLPIMLMFADMDGMKFINDNFGHKEGDSAIKNMAISVSNACLDHEICARFGGDEFIIFAPSYDDAKAADLKKRINDNITKYNQTADKPYQLSVSVGWHIEIPTADTTLNTLVTKADQKMYLEKKRKPYRRK